MPHSTPSAPCVKTCTKCGEIKPATTEYFTVSKSGKYGLNAVCKSCRRAYYLANREREVQRARDFYANNGEYVRARMKVYYEENKPLIQVRSKAYKRAIREKMLDYYREYYIRNRAKMNAQGREWRKANPDKERALAHAKRMRKLNAEGRHTAEDIERQYKAQKGRCYYCQIKVGDAYHVDHVIPLSRGGSNGPENIVIACPECNMKKHDKMPHEWAQGGRLL